MRKRPTINDVARSAKVSTAAVSFVLNDRRDQRISERVKRRVLDVAKRLDYHPRASASNLARRRTKNVVVLFSTDPKIVPNACGFSLIHGLLAEATRSDFNVIFSTIDTRQCAVSDLPKPIRERDAEGVLVINAESSGASLNLETCNVPVISIALDVTSRGAGMFELNDRRGGELAAEYLANLGHERLAIVAAGESCRAMDDRIEGFLAECHNRDIAFASGDLITASEATYDSGLQCGKELFRQTFRPTAVFAVTEELGAGLLGATRDMKLLVPGDLSVLGFASTLLGPPIDPALTTVGADAKCVGRYAMSLLLDSIRGAQKSRPQIDAAIVERTSTGPLIKHDARVKTSLLARLPVRAKHKP